MVGVGDAAAALVAGVFEVGADSLSRYCNASHIAPLAEDLVAVEVDGAVFPEDGRAGGLVSMSRKVHFPPPRSTSMRMPVKPSFVGTGIEMVRLSHLRGVGTGFCRKRGLGNQNGGTPFEKVRPRNEKVRAPLREGEAGEPKKPMLSSGRRKAEGGRRKAITVVPRKIHWQSLLIKEETGK